MTRSNEPTVLRPRGTWKGLFQKAARGKVQLFFALLLLVVGVMPAIALAEEPSSSSDLPLGLLQKAADSQGVGETRLTNPLAAERLPHEDLGRQEAVELIESVFEPVLQSAGGPFQDLEVEKYLGENAAVISTSAQPKSLTTVGGGGEPLENSGREETVLLESTIPLLTEGSNGTKEPVDLGLGASGDHLEPSAPLVAVQLPKELGDGIDLPESGIHIELAQAPSDRAPSVIDGSVAAYPNVAVDTDFSVAPTPTGLETFTTLRSPDSPLSQTLDLSLPPGAVLRQDQTGAEVEREGEVILKVLPPSAIDATGADVPVSLVVSGDSLTLTASPEENTAYPILLDPIVESYDWYSFNASTGMDTWHPRSTVSGLVPQASIVAVGSGLFIEGKAGHYLPGDQSGWYYWVPRLKEEEALGRTPSSYIARMTLWHLGFFTTAGSYSPYLSAGILGAGHWAGTPGHEAVWGYGGNGAFFSMNPGYELKFENGEPGKRDQTAKVGLGLALASVEDTWTSAAREAGLGSAAVEITDEDKPSTANGSISPWVNQTATVPLTAGASDTGLGVKNIGFDLPWKGPKVVANSCLGTASSPCPESWTASLSASQYNPAEMPQGFAYVPISAEDPVGNKAAPGIKALVKVDHTAPALAVSGTVTEQTMLGTSASQYTLKYSATDGDDETATASTSIGSVGTGEGQMQRPNGISIDGSGNIWMLDRDNKRIEKFDENGKFLLQFGSPGTGAGQLSEPRDIEVAPGHVWVSDAGNKRVLDFSPTGQLLRTITYSGFVEPYGLAVDLQGKLWVSDLGARSVFQFENGVYLRKVTGSPSGADQAALVSPLGIAIDPKGNLWVVDNGTYRIQEFSQTGKFMMQFGSSGSEPGQLKTPVSIAAAPSGNLLVTENLNNRVQVFEETGGYLRTIGSVGSGSGQLLEPRGIAVGADGRIAVADAGNHRIARWTHGDQDPQSGVVKVEIKVDGQVKSTPYNQACSNKNCLKGGEWIFKSSEYATGPHKVETVARDGVNLVSSKALEISTLKDTTPPQLSATSAFFAAPDGWLEQKTYSYNATATDPGGYGVKSLVLKIDGKVVKSVSQGCPNGGCSESLGASTINMATYPGGAHPAELIATDVANQTAAKKWTINVDPKGAVPVGEATDTLEAFEDTVEEMQPVAPTDEFLEPEIIQAGDNPGFQVNGGSLDSVGTPTSTSIDVGTETVTIEGADGAVGVTPVGEGSTFTAGIEAGVAAVTPSVLDGVDTVVRPEYNGALFFTDIRSPTSPEKFTWHVSLQPGQSLKAVNDQIVEIIFEDGVEMGLITAMPAHDATGAAVPTHLEVQGSNITLVVSHSAGSYVYPVVAGNSFQVGYSSVIVIAPPPPQAGVEEEESEAAEIEASANEPLTQSEFDDVTGRLFGAGVHRDVNKPVTLKQARHIFRKHRIRKTIPAPSANLIGGPGANGSGGYELTYDVNARTCSLVTCDIWSVDFSRETDFALVRTGSNSGHIEYASPYGGVHCGDDTSIWWSLNLNVEAASAGTRGPTVVYKNSGNHLTFWCKIHLEIWFLPELQFPETLEENTVLIDQVFANGYQKIFTQSWNRWLNPI